MIEMAIEILNEASGYAGAFFGQRRASMIGKFKFVAPTSFTRKTNSPLAKNNIEV